MVCLISLPLSLSLSLPSLIYSFIIVINISSVYVAASPDSVISAVGAMPENSVQSKTRVDICDILSVANTITIDEVMACSDAPATLHIVLLIAN